MISGELVLGPPDEDLKPYLLTLALSQPGTWNG